MVKVYVDRTLQNNQQTIKDFMTSHLGVDQDGIEVTPLNSFDSLNKEVQITNLIDAIKDVRDHYNITDDTYLTNYYLDTHKARLQNNPGESANILSMLYERLAWAAKKQDDDYFGYGYEWEQEMVQQVAWRAQMRANQCFDELGEQQQAYIVTKDPQVDNSLKFIYHSTDDDTSTIKYRTAQYTNNELIKISKGWTDNSNLNLLSLGDRRLSKPILGSYIDKSTSDQFQKALMYTSEKPNFSSQQPEKISNEHLQSLMKTLHEIVYASHWSPLKKYNIFFFQRKKNSPPKAIKKIRDNVFTDPEKALDRKDTSNADLLNKLSIIAVELETALKSGSNNTRDSKTLEFYIKLYEFLMGLADELYMQNQISDERWQNTFKPQLDELYDYFSPKGLSEILRQSQHSHDEINGFVESIQEVVECEYWQNATSQKKVMNFINNNLSWLTNSPYPYREFSKQVANHAFGIPPYVFDAGIALMYTEPQSDQPSQQSSQSSSQQQAEGQNQSQNADSSHITTQAIKKSVEKLAERQVQTPDGIEAMKEAANSEYKPQHKKVVEILVIGHLKASEKSYFRDKAARNLYLQLDEAHKQLEDVCQNLKNQQPDKQAQEQINNILKENRDKLSELTTELSQTPKAQNS